MLALVVCTTPLLMGVEMDVVHPVSGHGPQWTVNVVDGTAVCSNGSPVTGALFKKNANNVWVRLGPLRLTATFSSGGQQIWITTPDTSLGAEYSYSANGNYKVEAKVMDNATMATATDTNTWSIP